MLRDCLLIVFVKNPEPGLVKTRLAASIGHERAAEIYKKLLKSTRDAIEHIDCDIRVSFHDYIGNGEPWSSNRYEKALQIKGDLGTKMKHDFQNAFENYNRVCLIGSDIPDLREDHIRDAFVNLKDKQAVLGPSKDGGYYLVGFRKDSFTNTIFEGIEWSTDQVLEATLLKLKKRNLHVHLLPELSDIDTIEDLPPDWK